MPQYKLTYFDMPGGGRAESIRWIFTIAKVQFEDVRISGAEWAELKPKTPWGQVPILSVDGKEIGQSRTIMRFLGKKFNMVGSSEWDATKCDEISDVLEDINSEVVKVIFGKDDTEKEIAKKNLVDKVWPNNLPKLEKLAKANPGDFFVTKNVTWVDAYFAHALHFWQLTDKDLLKNYPNLKKIQDGIANIPEMKDYLKARAIIESKKPT